MSTQPELVHTVDALRQAVRAARAGGATIGLVPTMGALHEGHLSLVDAARADCQFNVATIFVNPTQFGPQEDFSKYPRTLPRDLELLATRNCDLVFAPAADEVYPPGHCSFVEMHGEAEPLEGALRPGHFRGVATVVLKLFNMVQPDSAYFGQKDFQQCLVIKRLARDFDLPIEIRVCPIVREPDGLAMSSRNSYLSADERRQALALSRCLRAGVDQVARGQRRADLILAAMHEVLASEPAVRLQYLVLADPETLAPVEQITGPAVALVAAHVGTTRLIDNAVLTPAAK